jgi:DNA-binding protein YbaB
VSNDSIRNEFGHVLALVKEQMRDLSNVQQQRSTLSATATAADGKVEVTVNAQRTVTKTVVDEAYLDEYELTDLGAHVTSAAQAAVQQLDQRAAALLAPMNERRKQVSEISGNVIGLPGFREALAEVSAMTDAMHAPSKRTVDSGDDESSFPTIRS